jgi:hypothetical protein
MTALAPNQHAPTAQFLFYSGGHGTDKTGAGKVRSLAKNREHRYVAVRFVLKMLFFRAKV